MKTHVIEIITKKSNWIHCFFALAIIFLLSVKVYSQGAAINSNGNAADPSAILDVSSQNQGLLIPRMTEAEKNAIANPATGLIIFQTDNTTGLWYFDGSSWMQSAGTSGSSITGNAPGDMLYWDGTQWLMIPTGQPGDFLQMTCTGVPA